MNLTVGLASAAGSGELLVTDAAARAAGWPVQRYGHRTLDLRDKSGSTQVILVIAEGSATTAM